ncbi:MAG TPA: M48 family metalloprotease [Leptolyngbyaceae cyanobacterium M65_K2018_010]|nr:M48 family metalloprotease [Leptolyngbyaceae cyanobacterium M65_K2018_010]
MAESQEPQKYTRKPPPSPPGQEPTTRAESLYQQGLNAFKGGDYQTALAQFEQVERLVSVGSGMRLKAQMGLVRVHQRLGHSQVARDRCQALRQSANPKVRQWAAQTLATLPPPAAPSPARAHQPAAAAAVNPEVAIGFVPLEDHPGDTAQSARVPAAPGPTGEPESTLAPAPTEAELNPLAATQGTAQSLFHFERLNQPRRALTPLPAPAASPSATPPIAAAEPVADGTAQEGNRVGRPPTPPSRQPQPRPRPPYPVWVVQGVTALATLWVLNAGLHWVLRTLNGVIRWVRWPLRLSPIAAFEQSHTPLLLCTLVVLVVASPWLMDGILAWGYGQRPLSTRTLQTAYPGLLGRLRQVCRSQGWQLPELRLIPDSAPLCFSYGWWPRYSRLVVSQGLLETCSEDELTALCSYELAHIANWDLPVISGLGLGLVLLYTAYWRLALWSNSLASTPARVGVGLGANGCYGLFWLLRKLALGLSRVRSHWCDRRAEALTQHPMDLHQGLLRLTAAIAAHLQQQQHLHPLLVSLEVLLPVSAHGAVSPGSYLATLGLADYIHSECQNPYRQWLMVNSSHPLLAERLRWLNLQALRRGQPVAIPDLTAPSTLASVTLPQLLLQKSPMVGLLVGGAGALALWLMGGVVNGLGWQRLGWLYQDPALLWGGLWLGLGLGLLVRINALYPDIRPGLAPAADPAWPRPERGAALPVYGQPISLEGRLLGAPGTANWLAQELYLATQTGVIRLLATSPKLAWQGLSQPHSHPASWVGRSVRVTGWQRQGGGLLWLDMATVGLTSKSSSLPEAGPQWATLTSLGLSLWGIYVILTGG